MPLETGDRIEDLVETNPLGTDPKAQGDDHLRLLKTCVKGSLPNLGPDALQLSAAQLNGFIGSIQSFPLEPGAGWLYCNGQAVSRTQYPILFAFYGSAFGDGDGSTTFNLPDLRGLFPRFQDDGAGVDPDAASRTARPDGLAGDNPGTTQDDEFGEHFHTTVSSVARAVGGGGALVGGSTHQNGVQATDDKGGNETRPKNIALRAYVLAG